MKVIVLLAIIATSLVCASPAKQAKESTIVINANDEADDSNDIDNRLFYYDPILSRRAMNVKNDLERESTNLKPKANDETIVLASPGLNVAAAKDSSGNGEKLNGIAFNSREVRLVGPDQREVEMKDDVATKVMVALDNLQKEATDVWGQVNEKLDKGWGDLKTMVEDVLAPKKRGSRGV